MHRQIMSTVIVVMPLAGTNYALDLFFFFANALDLIYALLNQEHHGLHLVGVSIDRTFHVLGPTFVSGLGASWFRLIDPVLYVRSRT